MSDKKISQLTGGGASQAADEYPINRGGSNFKITGANIAAAATSVGTLGSLTVSGTATVGTVAATTITEGGSAIVRQTDIGSAPNEIPLNQYLGTMAYQDAAGVNIAGGTATLTLTSSSASTTFGVGGATPSTSGSGISFPATQSASTDANTLDDYEEGTFTPTVIGMTDAGTATYTNQTGRYTKVGRLVTFLLRVSYSGGTGTGNLRVDGLPFTAASVGGADTAVASSYNNIALTASNYALAIVRQATTQIECQQAPTGGGTIAAIPYDAEATINVSGSYIV